MSESMTVLVPITCDRTGKVHKVPMSLAEAAAHEKTAAHRKDIAEQVVSFLGGLPAERPDLAVLFRGKVAVLNTVIAKDDAGILRLLHELTRAAAFPEVARTPRKNKTKAGKRASTTEVVSVES
jgi:hypothetical protein